MHYLKFNEKELPFRVDWSVINKLKSIHNLKPQDILMKVSENDFFDFIEDAIALGFQRGHELEKKEFTESVNDILTDRMDEAIQYFVYDVTWIIAPESDKKKTQSNLPDDDGGESDSKRELTFEYLFSIFVCHFSYSRENFLCLSIRETSEILNSRSEVIEADRLFQQYQNRLQSYFTVIAMAGSQKIKQPKDLYLLPGEEKFTKQQKDFLTRPLTKEEIEILSKV
jgi:hypothetical protein